MAPDFIQKATVKVYCGSNQGTGFFISPSLILTAWHVIDEHSDHQIIISILKEKEIEFKVIEVLDHDKDLDIALLEVDFQNKEFISLNYSYVPYDVSCSINGYLGGVLSRKLGKVSKPDNEGNSYFQIQIDVSSKENSYRGFSGSALIVDGGIAGLVKTQFGDKIVKAVGIRQLVPFLKKNNIEVSLSIPFANELDGNIRDLGERYTTELPSFDLPISRLFDGLARGEKFVKKNRTEFDSALKNIQSTGEKNFPNFKNEILKYKKEIKTKYDAINWHLPESIHIPEWKNLFEEFNNILYVFQTEIRNEQQKLSKENYSQGKLYDHYQKPFQNEEYDIRKNIEYIDELAQYSESAFFKLADSPFLILTGDAGVGKSHLLADICTERKRENLCSIFILGQKMLNIDDPWDHILKQAGFKGDKHKFLELLNAIGKWQGSRALIIIDALNEGEGNRFWKKYISSFIEEIKPYPYVGCVFSVRKSYIKNIIPDTLKNNPNIVIHEHKGFEGYEFEAVKHFCRYFKLEQPRVPLLAPEFGNPQFLLLLCLSLRSSNKQTLPEGLNGIMYLYHNYIDSINDKLAEPERLGYDSSVKIVQKSLRILSEKSLEYYHRNIPLEEALNLLFDLQKYYSKSTPILYELIQENILSKENIYDWELEEPKEIETVRFTFERFSDHLIIDFLLTNKIDKDSPRSAFEVEGYFFNFLNLNSIQKRNNFFQTNEGLIEALAIQLPEKFNIELFEVIAKPKPSKSLYNNIYYDSIVNAFIQSLLWRKVESINIKKCEDFIKKTVFKYKNSAESFFHIVLQICTNPKHPYNGDFLHSFLLPIPMPNRDAWWASFVYYNWGRDENERPYIVQRLIDWAWNEDINVNLSDDSIRLAAQTLAWFLVSSHKGIRDGATKALVCLLDDKISILIKVLKVFRQVDDAYISERLYAVAYGCVMRTNDASSIKELAQYVYEEVFKGENPPTHILWREYARCILEYALYQGINLNLEVKKIRPPYKSFFPVIPTDEEVNEYKIDNNSPKFKEKNYAGQNAIHFSVIDWDFNRYIINTNIDNFDPISFTKDQICKDFSKKIPFKPRQKLKLLEKTLELKAILEKRKGKLIKELKEVYYKIYTEVKESIESYIEILSKTLSGADWQFFTEEILPHWEMKWKFEMGEDRLFQTYPYAKWILKRVFDLGWNVDLHGQFDSFIHNHFSSRDEKRVERIGKKYQWIAFYEIMGILADNYYYRGGSWSNRKEIYPGSWENFIRNIDPSAIIKRKQVIHKNITKDCWWVPVNYDSENWRFSSTEWIEMTSDIPDLLTLLSIKDLNNEEWFNLQISLSWEDEPDLGEDRYQTSSRSIWGQVRSYFVLKNSSQKTFDWLQKQHFMGRWMPENQENHSLFNREWFWSPAFEYSSYEWVTERNKTKKYKLSAWQKFGKSNFKGISTVLDQNFSSDTTDSVTSFYLPCSLLYEKLKLKYGKKEGTFVNNLGEVVCFDPSVYEAGKPCLLVKKKDLIKFLTDNELEIHWTLLGEKLYSKKSFDRGSKVLEFSGVYKLNSDGQLEGGIDVYKTYKHNR